MIPYRKKEDALPGRARKNAKLIAAILLFLASVAICILYIRRTTVPLDCYEIGPANDTARWEFMLADGTELQPQDGKLPIDGENTIVICETELTGSIRDLPLIVVTSKDSDCAFFIDGQLLYAPSGRYMDGKFSDAAFSTASGQFGLPAFGDGKKLTMVVQFQGNEHRLSRMPKLTLYSSPPNYYSQHTSSAAEDALPAGVYFTVALFLAGMFLLGMWKQRCNPRLIILALCALSMAFMRTLSYSYSVIALLQTPTITWLSATLPQVTMSWMLWYCLSRKMRWIALPVPGIVTAAMLALFIVGLNNMNWVMPMNIMLTWIVPSGLLITLAAAAVDAAKGNALLRRFFLYLAWSVPIVAMVWVFSLLTGGKLVESMKTAVVGLTGPNHSLHNICGLLCDLLLILCFVQAVLNLIGGMAHQEAEMHAMALREWYAMENVEIMRQSQEETWRQRHEIKHHLSLLEKMLTQKQDDRAADYIRSLLAEAKAIPSDSYSDNMVVNAIACYYLNTAKAEGVRVETDIRTNHGLPLKDDELCILLTNLLENALEACRGMKPEQERFISLSMYTDGEHLHITCENSTDTQAVIPSDGAIPSSKSDAKKHGYGIPAMRRIVEKHYGSMNTAYKDKRFTVKITF